MLSIGRMHGTEYYVGFAKEKYYGGGDTPTLWRGEGAAKLGLVGSVESDAFRAIFAGFDTDGNALVQNAGKKERRPGWDLTFSAPKDVDVLWGISGAAEREEIVACHVEAVQAGLDFIENVAGWTRRGKGGAILEKAALVIATFRHGTSRALDPNLHTHCLFANVGISQDGRTRTIHSLPLYVWKMAGGAIYRLALAHALQRRLGLVVEKAKDGFTIRGVPAAISRIFSKRSQAIRAEMEKRGRVSARAAEIAALDTRQAKVEEPAHVLHEAWRKAAAELGFTPDSVLDLLHSPQQTRFSEAEVTARIEAAIEKLTRSQSHFTKRQVITEIATGLIGLGLSVATLLSAVDAYLQRSREIIHLQEIDCERHYALKDDVELEADLFAKCDELHARDAFAVREATIARTLVQAEGVAKRPQQTEALRHILSAGALKLLSGMPGTGKTFVLDAARKAWEREGYRVIGGALAGRAARELQSKANIPSETIAKLLLDLNSTPLDALKHHVKQLGRAALKLPTRRRVPIQFDSNTVLVIDECGMNGTREMHQLISHAIAKGAKVVLVGDAQQLSPITAGGPFRALLARYSSVYLTQIERQKDPKDVEAIHALARGDAKAALQSYENRGLVSIAKDRRRAQEKLIADWSQRGGVEKPDSHVILVSTNSDRLALNHRCQQARFASGKLDPERYATIRRRESIEGCAAAVIREDLHVGDRVMLLERSRFLGVENGDLGYVVGYDRETNTLSIRLDGRKRKDGTVNIPLAKYSALTLGYAATTHKLQGATVDHAYVLLGGSMQSLEMTYTQVSRAEFSTRLYADELDAGPGLAKLIAQIDRSDVKRMAHELLEPLTIQHEVTEVPSDKEPENVPPLNHDLYHSHDL